MKFPSQLHAALAARKSAFTLAAGFFLVPLAMPCETAFSTALSVTPFFTAFRTAFSIFLTALVCFLAIVQFLRSEDDLQLGIVHGLFPFVACFPRILEFAASNSPKSRLCRQFARRLRKRRLLIQSIPSASLGKSPPKE